MKAPKKCPCCSGRMTVSSVKCVKCGTAVTNDFQPSVFDNLNEEQTAFLLAFVSCDGNIRETERLLNISYPTVKSKLSAIKQALMVSCEQNTSNSSILDRLESGELSASEAIRLIKRKKGD